MKITTAFKFLIIAFSFAIFWVEIDKTIVTIDPSASGIAATAKATATSLVTNGTGQYIVTAVGMKSELGKIAGMLNETKQRKTPLQRTLDELTMHLE